MEPLVWQHVRSGRPLVARAGDGIKVAVYPADLFGCGHFRMLYPALALIEQGHDVTIMPPGDRNGFRAQVDDKGAIHSLQGIPPGTDVVVMQRVAHDTLSRAVGTMRKMGIAVVVDMDDDLSSIHPSNPAWLGLHPRARHAFSWESAANACRDATMVTTTTRALEKRYTPRTRVTRVIDNYVPDHYRDIPQTDIGSDFGYAGSLHSHPDDVPMMGHAVRTLTDEGFDFRVIGDGAGFAKALGLENEPTATGGVPLEEWPRAVSELGVGVAPLADSVFNAGKSRLKVLEMSALGVPWVASPRVEYEKFHQRHGVGFLAKRPRDWVRLLRHLMTSEPTRREQAEAGWAATQNLTYGLNAWRWMEAWSHAVDIQRGYARSVTYPGVR